jgi:glycosyltransferase involved in cell wall biosynthesis
MTPILREDPGMQIVCGGGGALTEAERTMLRNEGIEGRVVQTGVSDLTLVSLYQGASAFVYPSLYEGFGLPPLEAMQCGTPVVTSNVSSIPEIVGDSCLLADPCSIDSIAASILKLLLDEDEWHRFSLMGMEKAKEYSWQKTAVETLEVYEKCLKSF